MSEYLDHLIQSLVMEAEQARAELRLVLHKKIRLNALRSA
jgi:hypothetical protein